MSTIEDRAQSEYNRFAEYLEENMTAYRKASEEDNDEATEEAIETLEAMTYATTLEAIYPPAAEMEWSVLLGGNGPTTRLMVRTDFDGEVLRARYEYNEGAETWRVVVAGADTLEEFARVLSPFPGVKDYFADAI